MIELVAKTVPLVEGVDIDGFSAFIARIGQVKDNPERLVKYLIKHSHHSPFEHTFFTMKIQTSLAIGRELLRHRSFTFQERSLRYEESIGFEPIELRKQHETNRQSSTEIFNPVVEQYGWRHSDDFTDHDPQADEAINHLLESIQELYNELIKQGCARECARMILPSCTSTTMLMTGNIRSWIHFLAIRNHQDAQKEMQLLAREITEILANEIPITFNALKNGN